MNEDLKKKLLDDLKKTGYVSEMSVVKIFKDSGWTVAGGTAYFDNDSKKSREIDINALVGLGTMRSQTLFNTHFRVIADVKKTDKPWIVFKNEVNIKHSSPADPYEESWKNIHQHCNLPIEGQERNNLLTPLLNDFCIVSDLKWRGTNVHESFKPPSDESQWYKTFVPVCKAAETFSKKLSEERNSNFVWSHFSITRPVVILDGILVLAELTDDGEINLEEINAAPFKFTFKSESYNRESYFVDLVTVGYLKEYLSLCKRRIEGIYNALLPFIPNTDQESRISVTVSGDVTSG